MRSSQELEAEVEKNPANLDATLKLAKAQVQRQAFDQAVDLLVSASKRFPDQPEIADLLGDTRVQRLERRLEEARKASKPEDEIGRLESRDARAAGRRRTAPRRRAPDGPRRRASASGASSSRPTRSIPRSSSSSRR